MMPNNILNMIQQMNVNLNEIKGIKTPDEMAQYLLNSGRVNQNQVNQARQMWQNPQIQQRVLGMLGKK